MTLDFLLFSTSPPSSSDGGTAAAAVQERQIQAVVLAVSRDGVGLYCGGHGADRRHHAFGAARLLCGKHGVLLLL